MRLILEYGRVLIIENDVKVVVGLLGVEGNSRLTNRRIPTPKPWIFKVSPSGFLQAPCLYVRNVNALSEINT